MAADLLLERRGPLDGLAEALSKASSDAVHVEVAPARSIINLRGTANESLVTDVQMALGVELPLIPNRWHGDDRVAAVWLGPDEWLIVAPAGETAEVISAIREARANDPWLSLVDVPHNYTCLVLSGPKARDLLEKGCALDLRPDRFATGDCAQTVLAKAPVLLRASDADSFELWFRNSYALYAAKWLLDASVGPS